MTSKIEILFLSVILFEILTIFISDLYGSHTDINKFPDSLAIYTSFWWVFYTLLLYIIGIEDKWQNIYMYSLYLSLLNSTIEIFRFFIIKYFQYNNDTEFWFFNIIFYFPKIFILFLILS